MKEFKVLNDQEFLKNMELKRKSIPLKASVVYSSWAGGITTNPTLALVPLDDHMVHRGDAVFEAMRFGSGGIYLWTPHWKRLQFSADKIGIKIPFEETELLKLIRTMAQKSELNEGLIRIYLARGPGSFAVSPYDSVEPQLYVVLSPLVLPPASQYENGVKICLSKTGSKEGIWAQVKSCNYLVNVMNKKEAIDRGFDYGITQTLAAEITESSTENLVVLSKAGELLFPFWDNTLKGTTLIRVLEMADGMDLGIEKIKIRQTRFRIEDLTSARELMLIGTTLGVLPVGQFENTKWTDFSCAKILHRLVQEDLSKGVERRVSAAL